MEYFNVCKEIWTRWVPQRGHAQVLQGELLRQIERLRHEAQVNENRNWNGDLLYYCDFLRATLRQAQCLTPEEREDVNSALVRLRSCGEVACRYYRGEISREELEEDYNGELAYLDDDLYDQVCDAVALFYQANPDPIPYEHRRPARRGTKEP